jgi:uncharacterized protein YqeY
MTLQEQVAKDIVTAMKNKEKVRLEALRFLKSLFIQNNTAVKPVDDLSIVVAHVKKLQDSKEMYPQNSEQYTNLEGEIKIIQEYLPKALSEVEVITIINDLKAKGAKAMGDIMKDLQPQIKGRFDGKRASELVKAALS